MRLLPLVALMLPGPWSAGCSPPPETAGDGNATSVGSQDGIPAPAARDAVPPPEPAGVASASKVPLAFREGEFLGRWTGVEGMYLVVSKAKAPGRYRLEMQWDLDHHGVFEGAARGEPGAPRITFQRDGTTLTLVRTDGAATGLKYLAGKGDCVTVKPGEGYCRVTGVRRPS